MTKGNKIFVYKTVEIIHRINNEFKIQSKKNKSLLFQICIFLYCGFRLSFN